MSFQMLASSVQRCLALAFIALVGATACTRSEDKPGEGLSESPSAAARFTVNRTTPGLVFIWVDSEGEFQTTDSAAAVLEPARELVRILVPDRPAGDEDSVLVTDLRTQGTALEVRRIPRKEWESRGAAQRRAKVEAARPKEAPQAAPGSFGFVEATIYGADWCKPCHLAEDYLRAQGVKVTKKDIEEDPQAGSEMRSKLQAAGLGGASIPVIDLGGTILIGFSESSIQQVLQRLAAQEKP
jgi:glutaredoxin